MVQFNRLRLSGFKSFVEPTEFEIGHGLTGIVGPNGCGKSNLVEALRWVMGENSPKRMRSSGMDDVIFAGTEQRPARNTAEVTLWLDNTDRLAPAELNDSDELEVSRKIEREVGSVYKVNSKNVRMRDVQLLFADSSIGAHSPAMVSQGRVADMINAKPTQRRMVLEEAAGVSGLHARRHEAELKLRAAEQNLLRVDDVINAMNIQLEALKKQARQASRYRNLSGHISTAEGSLLYKRWMEGTTAVQTALHAFEAAESLVQDQTLIVTTLTTQQTEAAAAVPQLRQNEAEAASALQRLKLAYGGLESEERQVKEDYTKAETLLQQYTADVSHEQTQRTEAGNVLQQLQSEGGELKTAAESQSARAEETRILKEEQETAVENLETSLSTLTEDVFSQEAQRQSLEKNLADIERRLTTAQNRSQDLKREHADIVSNTPAQAELEHLSLLIASSEENYQAALANFDLAETERAAAETELNAATGHMQLTEKSYHQLSAEAEGLRRLLKNQHEGFQPILDQIEVRSGLEKALAVALGDDLQAALDGAAPAHWRELPEFSTADSLPFGVTSLTQFVQAPRALARALSQIGVVDNDAMAEQLMTDLKPGQCLVTRDGSAWRWDGLIVSASAENASAIRLEQKNRLSEIEALLVDATQGLDNARSTFAAAQERRDEIVDAVNTARQAFRYGEDLLNSLRRRHTDLTSQLTQITARLSSLATSIETTDAEINDLTHAKQDTQQMFDALPDTREGREKIASLKTELELARDSLAEIRATYVEIQRENDARNRRMQQITADIAGWSVRIERIDLRLAELEERITGTRDVLSQLSERPIQIEQEKQKLMSHIADAEKKRQDAADVLVLAETTANELQRELRAAESLLSDARESRAMAQASVNTTQHTQNGIEAQINEKFSCTPEALPAKAEISIDNLPATEDLQEKLERLIRERDNMGPVNLRADIEAQEITDKMSNMNTERTDLVQAIEKLREGINKLNKEARERLLSAFDVVNSHFQKLFSRLFQGGSAYLKLIEADDPLEAGLEIFAQPPGKKLQVLSLLSGGEQTLTSIALIFAMFLTNPAPICVLDEVDAPLDESNVDRYCTLLEDLSKECKTRFVVVTHHRMTMARMDRLYGVTMSERGVSQLVSVDLKQHEFNLEAAA